MLRRTITLQGHGREGKYLSMNIPQVIAEEMQIQKGDRAKIEMTNKKELKIKVERGQV